MKRYCKAFGYARIILVVLSLFASSEVLGKPVSIEQVRKERGLRVLPVEAAQQEISGESAIAKGASAVFISSSSKGAKLSGVQKLSTSTKKKYKHAKGIKPSKRLRGYDQARRALTKFAEDKSAAVTVRRKFILVQGSKGETAGKDGGIVTFGSSPGLYCYGESSLDVSIPEGDWYYSPIIITDAPACATVSSIDVHYEVIHPYIGDLEIDLTDDDSTYEYHLWENEGDSGDNISETETGITLFAGERVNQEWDLWAADWYEGDTGYIDYWWIKVYYDDLPSPANDNCSDAIAVEEGVLYEDSTCGARGIDESSGGHEDTTDVWHSFTAASGSNYRISLCGSDFDTTLAIFDECEGTELAFNDDNCGMQSEVIVNLSTGQKCLIRIAGYEGDGGNYRLIVNKCTGPVNDECVNAIPVVLGQSYTGSTIIAAGYDVWYSYTPMNTGLVTMSLDGSSFDTTLAVFEQCAGTELAYCDDFCDKSDARITMLMSEGNTYIIRIAGYDVERGDYTLAISGGPYVLPSEPHTPYPANGASAVAYDTVLSWNGNVAKTSQAKSKTAATSLSKETVLPKGIYGKDDRLDEYEVSDSDILATGDATVILVPKSLLSNIGDGTFALAPDTFADWYERLDPIDTGNPLCADEPFRDQPAPGDGSGFLVAPDIVATAGHCACPEDYSDRAIVFGFVMLDAGTAVLTIDESEIYYCSEVIAYQVGNPDWALLRLDREVTGHNPLPVRRTGIVPDGEQLLVIGYPFGLPRKYAANATVRDNSLSTYFQANLDTYEGSSGSVVLNANTLKVEGILAGGLVDFVEDGNCDRSNVYPDTGNPNWERVSRATAFGAVIPSFDVYFGTDPKQLDLICPDAVVPWCDPEPLQGDMTYYWQIVAKNSCGQSQGPLWIFSTGDSPHHPADTDSDYVISMLEILGYIDEWAVGNVSMLEVLEGIDLWAAGHYYWDPVDEKFKPGEP